MTDLIKKYLDLNQYSHLKNDFEESFLSHPDYPSIFAITDTLNLLEIENLAVKIPKEQFNELPELFMAVFNNNIVLVHKAESSIKIENEKGKQNLSITEFLNNWNGIILFVEPNPNNIQINTSDSKTFQFVFAVIALIILSRIYNQYSYTNYILLATSLLGFILSIFIIQEKLGIKNEIVSKICNINPHSSCDNVIKSTKSQLNKWVSFSDLPLLFFSINVLSILILPQQSSFIVGLLSLISLPFLLYSIWIQKYQIKKWCVLCLSVATVISIQSFVFLTTTFILSTFNITLFFGYLFSAVLISTIWFFIKPILETKFKIELEINELKKFKRNFTIFNFLSKDIPHFDNFNNLEGIQFGNRKADLQVTAILSPSCGHCHKAFDDGFNLASKFPNKVGFTVLFNLNPENNDNPYKIIVETLLTLNNLNEEKAKLALIDWHSHNMELNTWITKWNRETIDMKANEQIIKQYNWCSQNNFNFTPIKIINEKLFPPEYDISELKYFVTNFSEYSEIKKQVALETI